MLRAVVEAIHGRAGFAWAGIAFRDEGRLLLGPQAGEAAAAPAVYSVEFRGDDVAELQVAPSVPGDEARRFLERVALLVSPHCLAWDNTGREPLEP